MKIYKILSITILLFVLLQSLPQTESKVVINSKGRGEKYFTVLKWLFYDNQECLEKIHDKEGRKDVTCQKLLISKLLGLLIITVAAILKLPQIMKIIQNKSVAGLSMTSVFFETFLLCNALGINRWKGNPLTVYAEQYLMLIQNIVVLGLFMFYDKNLDKKQFFTKLALLLSVSTPIFFTLVPDIAYYIAQLSNMGFLIFARVPQIRMNYKNKSTGQLAGLTVLIEFVGTAIRSFTIIQETKLDWIVYLAIGNAQLLITIIFFQLLWYWNSKENKKYQGNRKKTNKEIYDEQLEEEIEMLQQQQELAQKEQKKQQEAKKENTKQKPGSKKAKTD